jgi:signal transduction histidine kinase
MAVMNETAALHRLLEVALAVAAERRTEPVLRTVLDAARDLAGARYAAIGVPDGDGGFATFLTVGIDSETWDRIGTLPRTHGLLGAVLRDGTPIRLDDLRQDPRYGGWWPKAHPRMTAFLGVPIIAGGEILAELYLADKADGSGSATFTDTDQRYVETLAGQAALALVNAQRHERARELSVAAERTRLARDLHDSLTQTLFSLTLSAESATTLAGDRDARLRAVLDQVRSLSTAALEELRTLVDTLRPADPDTDGLAVALRKRVELLRRVHDLPIDFTVSGKLPRARSVEGELMRIASEALGNALQHAEAHHLRVTLSYVRPLVRLEVADDGAGFDLAGTLHATRRLGLRSMRERAAALGGNLHIDTAPGRGTTVVAEVPL